MLYITLATSMSSFLSSALVYIMLRTVLIHTNKNDHIALYTFNNHLFPTPITFSTILFGVSNVKRIEHKSDHQRHGRRPAPKTITKQDIKSSETRKLRCQASLVEFDIFPLSFVNFMIPIPKPGVERFDHSLNFPRQLILHVSLHALA